MRAYKKRKWPKYVENRARQYTQEKNPSSARYCVPALILSVIVAGWNNTLLPTSNSKEHSAQLPRLSEAIIPEEAREWKLRLELLQDSRPITLYEIILHRSTMHAAYLAFISISDKTNLADTWANHEQT